jgi:hypothetical protein
MAHIAISTGGLTVRSISLQAAPYDAAMPPALSNFLIERTALLLIDTHGENAYDFAARRVAEEWLMNRDKSAADWRCLAETIAQLSHPIPTDRPN